MTETSYRTIVKTVSWRVIATIATFIVSYLISQNIEIASSIASIQIFIHTGLYFIHERVWLQINWGKTKKGA